MKQQKEGLKNKMQRKYLVVFFFIEFKNRKKRGTVYSKRDAKKSDFLRDTIFKWKVHERGDLFSQKWYKHG